MKISSLNLTNIGCYKSIQLDLATAASHGSNVTVLVGGNGAGKTTVLEAIDVAMSWFIARLKSEQGKGSGITETKMTNGENHAAISICLEHAQVPYRWSIAKTRRGRVNSHKSELIGATSLAATFRQALTDDTNTPIPLVYYYDVERNIDKIELKLQDKKNPDQLDALNNSGATFKAFFAWFRQREDIENEQRMSPQALNAVKKHLDDKSFQALQTKQEQLQDSQLKAVRSAISRFMPEYGSMQVRRKPQLHMVIEKAGNLLNVAQLSQGEKSLLALVGDIARRLAILNPESNDPLSGEGIVLIDEADLHLHPKWQRNLIDNLSATFPNCQFVLTTHSPLVISDTEKLLCYIVQDNELQPLHGLFGEDANQILLQVMSSL